MKRSINIALKIYKYLLVLYSIVFWVYVIIDDHVFIEKNGSTHWLEYFGIWLLYFFGYLIALSIYFWLVTWMVIILLNFFKKLGIRTKTENKNAL